MISTSVQGRIPGELNQVVLMTTLLMPGTSIIYYGDEIGMSTEDFQISCADTQDPYALPPYSTDCDPDDLENDYPENTRDLARTPMQVRYYSTI